MVIYSQVWRRNLQIMIMAELSPVCSTSITYFDLEISFLLLRIVYVHNKVILFGVKKCLVERHPLPCGCPWRGVDLICKLSTTGTNIQQLTKSK